MKRLILLVLAVVVVATVSAGAWMLRGEEPRRLGATGSVKHNCPPWAPVLRVNAFGGKYCSAYTGIDGATLYVGTWASVDFEDYRRDPCPTPLVPRPVSAITHPCCPDWAPVILPNGSGGGTCSRYDGDGRLYKYNDPTGYYQGLYPAAPQPPKPAS